MNKHIESMIGRKFGKLTVISHHSRTRGYLCKCECGGTTLAGTDALKKGRHTSCSCGKYADRKRKPDHHSAKREVWNNYKQAAKRRNYEFSITQSEFFELILTNCFYCGSEPTMTSTLKAHKDFKFNGVDRRDNNIGYNTENCVACCKACNNSKSTMTIEEWLEWIYRLAKYQNITFND